VLENRIKTQTGLKHLLSQDRLLIDTDAVCLYHGVCNAPR